MFDNLNTLLLDIFKESRLSGEPYTSKMQEIEAVSVLGTVFIVFYLAVMYPGTVKKNFNST